MYIGAAPADPGPARTAPQIRIQFQECRCRQDTEDKLPGGYDMAVKENENREIVDMIREGLRQRNGLETFTISVKSLIKPVPYIAS